MPKPACPTITSWEEIWAPNIDCACGWVPTLGASGAWYLLESPGERWRNEVLKALQLYSFASKMLLPA